MGVKYDKTQQLINKLDQITTKCLSEVGITGNTDLVANCPVHKIKPGEKYAGVPGTLRKGHHYKTKNLKNSKSVTWGNYVYYAPYVEFKAKGRGGNPWFRQTLRTDKALFLQIVRKHLKQVEEV